MIRADKLTDIRKMKDEAEALLRYSYQFNDIYGQAFSFLHLAIYYIMLRKLDSAKFHLAKAKALCVQEEYNKLLLSCFCYEGTISQLSGNKVKAIRDYCKAMNIAEKQKDNTILSVLLNNMAMILMDYNDMELAKEYFESAAGILREFPEQKYNLVQVYANLVRVCCVLQDQTTAWHYFKEAKVLDSEQSQTSYSLKASEIRLYAENHDIPKVEQAYAEYIEITNCFETHEGYFASDVLLVAENLLIADLKEPCHTLLKRVEELIDCSDIDLELQLYKLYIRYLETYAEESAEIYEKYYHLLMQSEGQEYGSLAESLRGRIELSEVNQKQTILEKENETLQKQAHLDEMTGVFNRRYFDKLLLKINFDRQVQHIGCIMLDIDHFKEYNDTYGHFQGDQILKKIAELLTKHTVEGIYVGRFGGDEFYCLCANLEDKGIETYLLDVYKDLHAQQIEHRKNTNRIVTISAGYCNETKLGIVLSNVLECADQALYSAKKKGRNSFMKYTKD